MVNGLVPEVADRVKLHGVIGCLELSPIEESSIETDS